MSRATIEIPDELQAKLQARLQSENTTVEDKAVALLREYADSGCTVEEQIEAGLLVMERHAAALRDLAQ